MKGLRLTWPDCKSSVSQHNNTFLNINDLIFLKLNFITSSLISRTSLNSVNEKLFHSDLPLTTGIACKECKNDFINFWLSAKACWFTLKEVKYALYLLYSINILIFNKQ